MGKRLIAMAIRCDRFHPHSVEREIGLLLLIASLRLATRTVKETVNVGRTVV